MIFQDRHEAGRMLARRLANLQRHEDLIVLGIPRGGVVVAYEIARELQVPLDVYITRKIGAPHNPELAIGAVASDGTIFLDDRLIQQLGVPQSYVDEETQRQEREIERRLTAYRGSLPEPDLGNKMAVLVDDGVATGATVSASLRALKRHGLQRLILAVPVGPAETIRALAKEADEVVCLQEPELFWAVGAFYAQFDQTSDDEVVRLLQALR